MQASGEPATAKNSVMGTEAAQEAEAPLDLDILKLRRAGLCPFDGAAEAAIGSDGGSDGDKLGIEQESTMTDQSLRNGTALEGRIANVGWLIHSSRGKTLGDCSKIRWRASRVSGWANCKFSSAS